MKKYTLALLGVSLLLLLSGCFFNEPALVAGEMEIQFTSTAPILDGKVNDGVWANIPWHESFTTLTGAQAAKTTKVKALWDDNYLYVAFYNAIPSGEIKADMTKDGDAVWADDDNEIFINPQGNHQGPWYQLAFNSVPARAGFGYNGGAKPPTDMWSVKIDIQATYYTAEVAIAWDALGGRPAAGQEWGANFTRRVSGAVGTDQEWLTWSPDPTVSFLDPTIFGTVKFKK